MKSRFRREVFFLLGCFFGAVQYFFYVCYTVRVQCTYRGTERRRVRRI